MQARAGSSRMFRSGALALAVLALAAWGAGAAAVGGGYWSAVGPGRIAIKRSGIRPLEIFANLRLDFAGTAEDVSGNGTVTAYDAIGQDIVAEFPFLWTTRRGAAFQADLANVGFASFVEDRIAEATGKTAAVTLLVAKGRGVLSRTGDDVRMVVIANGEVSLDGGAPQRFTVKMRLQ